MVIVTDISDHLLSAVFEARKQKPRIKETYRLVRVKTPEAIEAFTVNPT